MITLRMTTGQDIRGLSQTGYRTKEPPISWLMGIALAEPGLVNLAAGFTDSESLPVDETRALIDDLLRTHRHGASALQYGTTAGIPELRERTLDHVIAMDRDALRGIATADRSWGNQKATLGALRPDDLLITHGSQQLLYLVTQVLCDVGDLVLVEAPTYFVYLGILQSLGVECRSIPLEPDGLSLSGLEAVLEELRQNRQLHRLKLLYLVSYFQNPTGTTTSFAKKQAALALLRRYERPAGHRLYLFEDAAYRELRFSGDDVPSTLGLDGAAERVIYAGTFSKPFATGVRVGYGWLPPAVRKAAMRVKGGHDFGTSNFLQHLVLAALRTGTYHRHVTELRRRYARKAQWMTEALRENLSGRLSWREPLGGLYVWAAFPKSVRCGLRSRFFRRALDGGVLYVPGSLCYAPGPARKIPDHEMRLSFGSANRRSIEEGLARLGKAARRP